MLRPLGARSLLRSWTAEKSCGAPAEATVRETLRLLGARSLLRSWTVEKSCGAAAEARARETLRLLGARSLLRSWTAEQSCGAAATALARENFCLFRARSHLRALGLITMLRAMSPPRLRASERSESSRRESGSPSCHLLSLFHTSTSLEYWSRHEP